MQNDIGWWFSAKDGTYPYNEFAVINGTTYHFDQNGYMDTGWYKTSSAWYYLSASGGMYKNGWAWIDGDCYYFDENGRMARNSMINGNYVNKDGKWIRNRWMYNNSIRRYWYRYGDGSYPCNEFVDIDGETYHFDRNGYMDVGWVRSQTAWGYCGTSGAMYKSRWAWIDGSCYYFDEWGRMATDTFIDGDYVDESGKWIEDKWVYSTWAKRYWYRYGDGSYPCNEFVDIDGETYHFDKGGYMDIGWVQTQIDWVYCGASGAMYKSRWAWIDGICYYFDEWGRMARDTTIDGFYVDASGAWIK